MERHRIETLLALSLALISVQIGTNGRCFAAQAPKTVELHDPQPTPPESGRYPSALLSLDSQDRALLVDKKTRTLTVWESEGDKIKPVAEFAVDLGAREGNKTAEGDRKTPEGIYFFQSSMDGHKLDFDNYGEHVFTTDYPNVFDQLEKKTGKGIWLHAIPDSKSLKRGSHGCVVVRNKAIEELEKYIEVKRTPMIVLDQVEYLNGRDWTRERSRWKKIFPDATEIFTEGTNLVVKFGQKVLYAVQKDEGLKVIKEVTASI